MFSGNHPVRSLYAYWPYMAKVSLAAIAVAEPTGIG